ncbi:glycosyltransferase family 4 protein [bacterium]|nr:glycosyltransferase family 4 protein [bacterium]
MSKMLFYGVSSHLGGAERSLIDFLKYYQKSSSPKDFYVLLPKEEGPLVDKLKKYSIEYKILPFPSLWIKLSRQSRSSQVYFLLFGLPSYFIYLFRLYRELKRHPISVIHSTGIKCHLTLCLLEPLISSQIVIHFRDLLSSPLLQKLFLPFKNRKKIRWITASQTITQTFPEMPTEAVYCGFSDQQYAPKKNTYLHDLLKIPHDHRLVGLVGVYARWKGQKEYILAANCALQSLKNCHFLIIGGQIYDTSGEKGFTEQLRNLVKALNHESSIHFVPFQQQPDLVYNSLDLLVHCSIEPEPFGRVIVEGMFCEVPVVASAAGGALEIIRDETYGLLHKPGDYQDLANQILKSLEDPERIEKARSAAKKIRNDYSLEGRFSILKKILEQY